MFNFRNKMKRISDNKQKYHEKECIRHTFKELKKYIRKAAKNGHYSISYRIWWEEWDLYHYSEELIQSIMAVIRDEWGMEATGHASDSARVSYIIKISWWEDWEN